jgi:hypothetical protein
LKKSTGKGRWIPTKTPTPVIAGRVPKELHRQIKQAAKQSGRTMSDELAWRVGISFEWEKVFGTVTKMINDNARMLEGDLRAGLRMKGWIPVPDLTGTMWLEPGMPIPPMKGEMPDGLKEAIVDAVRQAKGEMPDGLKEAIIDAVRQAIAETKKTGPSS